MKTHTGEIISKKEALIREAVVCGFQRFEAEAIYNCLRRFESSVRVDALLRTLEKEKEQNEPTV